MELIRIRECPTKVNPRGIASRHLVDREHIHIVNLTLQPGQAVERHVTPVDVVFHVIEGQGSGPPLTGP